MANKTRFCLPVYFCLPAVEAVLAIGWILSRPSDAQTALLFGLSPSRLIIVGVLFLAALGLLSLSIFIWQKPQQTHPWLADRLARPRWRMASALSSGLIFLAASAFLAVPQDYLGKLWAIEERLRPFTLWVLLFSFQILAGIVGWQARRQTGPKGPGRSVWLPTAVALGSFLGLWALISLTKLGLSGGNSFWSKAGVPLLWPQIFLALALGLGLHYFLGRAPGGKISPLWLDLGLCSLFWLAAVLLWSGQSYAPGVFNTPARPPTYQIYPINDSLIFDVTAQKMLIGREMSYTSHDKPVFIAYLVLLHLLAGENFSLLYLLQIFSFAFIPVCGYLLGKNLHSRPAGAFFAILLIFKEQNAIALTNYIQVSTSKLILSEMLTTLGVLLFTLALVRWLKAPKLASPSLWLAGGLLGLTSLARLNAISILPAAMLLIGLALKFKWKPWIFTSLVFTIFLLVSAAPWVIRNVATVGDPFDFIRNKTNGVIGNQRYDPILAQNTPAANDDPAQPPTSKLDRYLTLVPGITTNYLHNLVGVTLMLPPTPELYQLLDLVRLPYWKMEWDGSLLPGAFWMILGVLALTALGLASAWRRWRAAGLVPLVVMLGYNLTTAVSLTSGGRYLVPFDWVVIFYFALGLYEAAFWLLTLFGWPKSGAASPAVETSGPPTRIFKPLLLISSALLLLGALPVLLENLPPQRYPRTVNLGDLISANQTLPALSTPEMAGNLRRLGNDPLAKVLYGQALYPRYYGENKGDGPTVEQDPLIGNAGFDHLAFLLIDDHADTPILLPYSGKISPALAGADVWVLGCQRDNYVEAVLIVLRSNDTVKIYQQEQVKTRCQ
jgi:hypothetical protein